jgi:hypothetical protein
MVAITGRLLAKCSTKKPLKHEKGEDILQKITHVNLNEKEISKIENLEVTLSALSLRCHFSTECQSMAAYTPLPSSLPSYLSSVQV